MTLTITSNITRDYNGVPTVAEGGVVEWRIASSDPALGEAVQITPYVDGNTFPADIQPQTVSFFPGSDAHMFVQFQTLDDSIYEVGEFFYFGFTPIGNTALSQTEWGGNVRNNDSLPSLSIKARENTVLENAADPVFRFDITRTGQDLSVVTDAQISFQGIGPTPAESSDFTGALAGLTPQLVRFAPGETSKTLELQIVDDANIEGTESLDAYFSQATSTSPSQYWGQPHYNPIEKYSAVVSIIDNDSGISPPPPSPAPLAAYRFYNTETGSHFFTISVMERDIVQNALPQFKYEGVGFTTVPEQPGSDPIYRFYNTETQTHFFTPDATERDSVIANLKQFNYEGVGFHASTQDAAGLTEVYRFYNTETQTHFYTPSILERDIVRNTLSQFNYEGVGFWVPDSPDYLLS